MGRYIFLNIDHGSVRGRKSLFYFSVQLISKIVKHILRDRSRIWDDVETSYESRVTYFIGTR